MQLDDELLKIFLAEIASYQAILEDADAELEDQAAAAHGLKGAAGMVGFPELQTLAKTLEHSLRDEDAGPRDEHLPRIREIIDEIAGGAQADDDAPAAKLAESAAAEDSAPAVTGEPTPSGVEADMQEPPPEEGSGFDAETTAMLQGFFLEEAADHLSSMESELDRLTADPGNTEAVHGLFRASHTLKGAAATVELSTIGRAAHLLEDRFEAIRDAGAPLTAQEVERLTCCSDLLRAMVEDVSDSARADTLHAELAQILEAPLELASTPRATGVDPASEPDGAGGDDQDTSPENEPDDDMGWDEETRAILLETFHDEAQELLDELDPLVEELAGGSTVNIDKLFRLAHTLKGSAGAVGLGRMSKAAHALEDQLEALRSGADKRPPPDLTDVLSSLRQLSAVDNASPEAKALLKQALRRLENARGTGTRNRRPTLTTLPVPRPPDTSLEPEEPLDVTVERRDRTERRAESRRGDDERMIRVNAERLDALLNSTGEIVFRRTLIERRSEELTGLVRDLGASHQSLRSAVVALRDLRGADYHVQRFSELEIEFADVLSNFDRAETGLREETEGLRKDALYLQDGLTQIRLLSVRYLFARLRRSVRDIARSESKQVTLQVQGEDTEIDKVVAEKIADPMIQIIRNAVAHGIESPQDRQAVGKPAAGTVAITAVQENNFVTLEVSDDGCGIDLQSIREALTDKGLMSADEAAQAADAEVTAAIFLPGLSTRRKADAVAGRGVGLDVVRDTISKLGGEVTVHSERGQGTRFTVRMPLSTAVTNALLFKSGGEVFCIPIRWVAETRTTKASDVLIHRGRDAIVHRDKTIPLLRLAELLGTEARLMGKFLPTIILRHLEFEFALVVDKLIGPREIVLRELGPLLEPLDIYASATISGAGKVQLVLDVPTLHVWASAWRTLARAAQRAALPPPQQTRILVCDDSRSIREVVSRILQAEGYGVELAQDGWDAWERMTGLRVDLLLTDLEMPRMDGYTLIEKVRKENEYQGLPILVLSSRTGDENQRRAKRAGADGFLFKPVNRRVIVARVEELLRS